MEKCKNLNLDSEYISCVKSNKSHHNEDTNFYYAYLNEFESWKWHHMFSGQEIIFRGNGDDIFDSLGFGWHKTFTPSVRQPLSIIDSHLHHVANAAWYWMRGGDSPDWGPDFGVGA